MTETETTSGGPKATYDPKLLFSVLILLGIGLVMVYSASSALAFKKWDSEYYFLKRQGVFSLIGIVGLVIFSHIPFRVYRALAYPALGVSLTLLTLVLISGLGVSAGGSTRWLRLGPISFQPAEIARLSMIMYLAYSLSKKQESLRQFTVGFIPHVVILVLLALPLLAQPDFGSVVILGCLTWAMMFVGGVPMRYLLSALLALVPLAYYTMIHESYRVKRLITFMDPWQYPADEGYQIIHSLMAFGTGGMWGAGLGRGYQKLFYLPEPHTDFIFSVIGEELGFLGVLFILGLYGIVLWRGLRLSCNCREGFGMLLGVGITLALALQVSINLGVALGMLPTKGLTLPFLSYGGTSLVINMVGIGILMNIGANHARARA